MKRIILFFLLISTFTFSAIKEIVVAGGCFWCTESDMEKLNGVREVISGYSGGNVENPAYKEVSSGVTGHRESILIKYDDSVVSLDAVLNYFLHKIDPTDSEGSFVDRGFQYSPAIFYKNEAEKKIALAEIEKVRVEGNFTEMKVAVEEYKNFYLAEDYHQDYYKKNFLKYSYYRYASGRDQFLEKVWGKK